jgi:hypothetical protein
VDRFSGISSSGIKCLKKEKRLVQLKTYIL